MVQYSEVLARSDDETSRDSRKYVHLFHRRCFVLSIPSIIYNARETLLFHIANAFYVLLVNLGIIRRFSTFEGLPAYISCTLLVESCRLVVSVLIKRLPHLTTKEPDGAQFIS